MEIIASPARVPRWRPEKIALEQAFSDILHWPVFTPWKAVERDGKTTKVPCSSTGRPVSIKTEWLTFDEAWRLYASGKFDGIGVKLGCGDEEGGYLCALDIDAKDLDSTALEQGIGFVRENLGFSRTYAEYSPSGRGIHVIFWARPESEFVNTTAQLPSGARLEIYVLKEERRFLTLTGAKVPGFGNVIADCTAELKALEEEFPVRKPTSQNAPPSSVGAEIMVRRGPVKFSELPEELKSVLIRRLKKDPKFSYLFNRGHDGKGFWELPSPSEEDFYFVRTLVKDLKKAGYSKETIVDFTDLAMRASKLFRAKWDSLRGDKTYGVLTIEKALSERAYPPIVRVSARNILTSPGDPPREVIKSLLTEGVTLLGGWPKTGKTWLALEVAVAVATGKDFLGQFPVVKGQVLYLALEESEFLLLERLRALLGDEASLENSLFFAYHLNALSRGGLEQLAEDLEANPGTSLVIIDPLVRVREPKRKGEANIYQEDYEALAGLQDLAKTNRLAFLVIHHLRKEGVPDPVLALSGSTGLTAAADAVWVLKQMPGGRTLLHVRGRNVKQSEFLLRFDGTRWLYLGDARVGELSPGLQEILALLPSDKPVTFGELKRLTRLAPSALSKILRKLVDLGLAEQPGRGLYRSLYLDFSGPRGEKDSPFSP